MRAELPDTLCQRRRRALWAASSILVVMVALAVLDVTSTTGVGVVDDGEHLVSAEVREVDGERVFVYDHPITDQEVESPIWVWTADEPEVGDRVDVVVGGDPLAVDLHGDRFGSVNLPIYLLWLVVGACIVGTAWWSTARIARLVNRDSTVFSMVGVIAPGRWLRRRSLDLHLFALDAEPGSTPVCTVPLATIPSIGIATKFSVEVKGSPRPLGRVAARAGGTIMWPRRRALRRRALALPPGPIAEALAPRVTGRPPAGFDLAALRRSVLLPSAAFAAAAVLVGFITVLTVRGAAHTEEFIAGADVVVGEVTGYDDVDYIVELTVIGSDRIITMPDEGAERPVGVRYQLYVDPDPSVDGARIVGIDYDIASPIGFAALPLVVAGWWLLNRLGQHRRLRRVAESGPWHQFTAVVMDSTNHSEVVILDERQHPVLGVPLRGAVERRHGFGEQAVTVAGDLGVGAMLAVWGDIAAPAFVSRPARSPGIDEESMRLWVDSSVGNPTSWAPARPDASPHEWLAPASPVSQPQSQPPQSQPPQSPLSDGPGNQPAAGGAADGARIALASYWFHRHKPELIVVADTLVVSIKRWFGSARWAVPLSDVGVVLLPAYLDQDVAPDSDETMNVYSTPVHLPYLVTTGNATEPTIGLLFRTPQRVPRVRWSAAGGGLSWRRSRSEEGVIVDGLLLRATYPELAVRTLGAAGAEVLEDPEDWLAAHRDLETNPEARQRIIGRERRSGWIHRVAWVLGVVAVALLYFGAERSDVLLGVGLGAGVVSAGLYLLASRLR